MGQVPHVQSCGGSVQTCRGSVQQDRQANPIGVELPVPPPRHNLFHRICFRESDEPRAGLRLDTLRRDEKKLDAVLAGPYLQLLDFQVLTTMVKTILERLPCRSVHIVAFNLDKQIVLFERDGFTADGWSDLEATLKSVQLSTIDYRALQAGSERDFLAHLVEKEISGPTDAVVLVGERTHFLGKTPNEIRASLVAGGAKPYYLRSDYYPVIPDDISYLVQDLQGTVLPFFSPGEFGKSVEQLRTELANPSAARH